METTAQKLIKLADIKESIRRAIVDKGFEIAEGAAFAEYAVALGGTAPSHGAFNNTDDRLKYIGDIKSAIRAAIIAGGVDVPENTSFGAYASKIAEITIAQRKLADYTVQELKMVAEDLSKNGTSSKKYEEFHGYLERDEHWPFQMTDGTNIEMRIVGICHDTKESNGSYAGLTMQATKALPSHYNTTMDGNDTQDKYYGSSPICSKLNSGEIYNLIPQNIRENIELVRKCSFYVSEVDYENRPRTDISYFRMWMPSSNEIYGDVPDIVETNLGVDYPEFLAEIKAESN